MLFAIYCEKSSHNNDSMVDWKNVIVLGSSKETLQRVLLYFIIKKDEKCFNIIFVETFHPSNIETNFSRFHQNWSKRKNKRQRNIFCSFHNLISFTVTLSTHFYNVMYLINFSQQQQPLLIHPRTTLSIF